MLTSPRRILLIFWWVGFIWSYVAILGFIPFAVLDKNLMGGAMFRWLDGNDAMIPLGILSLWSWFVMTGLTNLDSSHYLKRGILGDFEQAPWVESP